MTIDRRQWRGITGTRTTTLLGIQQNCNLVECTRRIVDFTHDGVSGIKRGKTDWNSPSARLRGVLHSRHNACIRFECLSRCDAQGPQTGFYPAKAISSEIFEPLRQQLPNKRSGKGGPSTWNSFAAVPESDCSE